MAPICDALRCNTHLGELIVGSTNLLSERFARERLIPAAFAVNCELGPPQSFIHLHNNPALPPVERRRTVHEVLVEWRTVVDFVQEDPTPPQGGRFLQWLFGFVAALKAVGRART